MKTYRVGVISVGAQFTVSLCNALFAVVNHLTTFLTVASKGNLTTTWSKIKN